MGKAVLFYVAVQVICESFCIRFSPFFLFGKGLVNTGLKKLLQLKRKKKRTRSASRSFVDVSSSEDWSLSFFPRSSPSSFSSHPALSSFWPFRMRNVINSSSAFSCKAINLGDLKKNTASTKRKCKKIQHHLLRSIAIS